MSQHILRCPLGLPNNFDAQCRCRITLGSHPLSKMDPIMHVLTYCRETYDIPGVNEHEINRILNIIAKEVEKNISYSSWHTHKILHQNINLYGFYNLTTIDKILTIYLTQIDVASHVLGIEPEAARNLRRTDEINQYHTELQHTEIVPGTHETRLELIIRQIGRYPINQNTVREFQFFSGINYNSIVNILSDILNVNLTFTIREY